MALFYGGQEIIPFLSSDLTTATSSNMSNWILIALSPLLQLTVYMYKKIKFRREIKYEQELQQTLMLGVRNVYGPLVIFLGFLGFIATACFHLYVSLKNRETLTSNDSNIRSSFRPVFFMTMIFAFAISISFIRNPKLR